MILLALLACHPRVDRRAEETTFEVRFRPADPPGDEARRLVEGVPGSGWDLGLADAAARLASAADDPYDRFTPMAIMLATAGAGYPGDALFLKQVTQGGFPTELLARLEELALQRTDPVDVGLARRAYGDRTLWVAGIARRPLLLNPAPRDLPLDELLPVTVAEVAGDGRQLALFVAPPGEQVRQFELTPLITTWVDTFHRPGLYRLEVVSVGEADAQVLLTWTEAIEAAIPEIPPLPSVPAAAPSPVEATEALYTALNQLRAAAGLSALARFAPYEALAREHAAVMGARGVLAHVIPGASVGVEAMAAARFRPDAHHREALAAASTWQDALDSLALSAGHRATLLCGTCTHVAIGVALEPVTERVPRLFVTMDLLEFPSGEPRPVWRAE